MEERQGSMTIMVDGKEVKCNILFTFNLEEFNHSYVVFEVGDTKELSAMIFEEKDGNSGTLMPIENEEEWDQVEEAVNQYFEEQAKHHHHHHEGCHCEDCDGCDCDDKACDGDCDCDHEGHDCGCHHHE